MRFSRRTRNRNILQRIVEPLTDSRHGGAPDYGLLIAVATIVFLGLIVLSSATSVISFERTKATSPDSYFFLKQQLAHGILIGSLLFFVLIRIPYRSYLRYAPLFLVATVVLLLVVRLPGVGLEINGVRGWIGIAGATFQTSELAKLTFVLWLAGWLSSPSRDPRRVMNTIAPFLVCLSVISLLLMAQPDMGALAIFVAVGFAMLFVGNASLLHMGALALMGVLAAVPLVVSAPYRLRRLSAFLNPEADIQGAGYQLYQALLAIGSGHWFGLGLGQSRQKLYYLPEVASDSIFAIIGEEGGFVLAIVVILLLFIIFWRGVRIARSAPDSYATLLALGLTAVIIVQALINIGAMLGLVPLTGVPLPFVSLGGSNLIMLLAAMGILANISKYRRA